MMAAKLPEKLNDHGLWAITSYFNPVGYQRRRANYRIFRERLKVPLLAIELEYGPAFELGEGDADILIQLRGRDVLWQKERLLNLALDVLPDSCRYVAWLDCDIILENDEWPDRARQELSRVPILQPFDYAYRTPQEWRPGEPPPRNTETYRSGAFMIASGLAPAASVGADMRESRCANGFAWVARREFVSATGFFDSCIIGGGDGALARAAYGFFDQGARFAGMTGPQRKQYIAWAESFYAAVRGEVGFVEGALYHLWHGDTAHRQWVTRYEALTRWEFDPFSDIALASNGLWRWASDKPELHAFVRDHFFSRREDGLQSCSCGKAPVPHNSRSLYGAAC